MKKLTKKQIKKIEKLGWNIEEYEDQYFLSIDSPLGEDFGFNVAIDNAVEEIIDYAYSFDAEEHAELFIEYRGTRGIPNSIRDLLDDADAIKNMLDSLVKVL